MFDERPNNHHDSGHRRNLSSVSTYSCPVSLKLRHGNITTNTGTESEQIATNSNKNDNIDTTGGHNDVNIPQSLTQEILNKSEDNVEDSNLKSRHT